MNNDPNIKCPLCSGTSTKHLHFFNSDAIQVHLGIESIANDAISKQIEKLWGGKKCEFRTCTNCKLTFADPFVAGDSKLYNLIYSSGLNYPKWKWEFDFALNSIKEIHKPSEYDSLNILEIGAGVGSFLNQLIKDGFNRNHLLATEFSEHGKKQIESYGVKCLSSDLKDLCTEENKEKFDVIVLFQVLEHLQDFNGVFKSLDYLLKPKGSLILSVPNNYHREFFEALGYKEDVPPIHISRWNRSSFNFLEKNYQLKIVTHLIEPNRLLTNISKLLRFKYGTNSLLSRVNNIEKRLLRLIVKSIILFPLALLNIRFLPSLQNKNLGISQSIHFRKS